MKHPIKGSIEYKYFGAEPSKWNKSTLNWYNYFSDKKDYQRWFQEFNTKNKLNIETEERIPSWVSVAAHFKNTKRELPDSINSKFNNYISELLKSSGVQKTPKGKVSEKENKAPVLSIQDRIKAQVQTYCGTIDGEIDKFIDNKYISKFNIKEFSKDIKGPQAKQVKEFYLRQYNDTLIKDEFTKEGYSYMSKAEFKLYQNFLKNIISAMESREKLSKASKQRTPRKKKETPAYKKVQKLQYKDMFKELNLVSLDPEKLIGSNIVILYNTKSNSLHYLVSTSKFDARGTSLVGLDDKKSFKIKLRKPEEFFDKLGGARSIDNKIRTLKTKKTSVSARINKDCIIYKVF